MISVQEKQEPKWPLPAAMNISVVSMRFCRASSFSSAMPGSRFEVFPNAGHFPFRTDPARFVGLVEDFIAATEPASWSPEDWRELLRSGRLGTCAQTDPVGFTTALRLESERSAT